MRFFLCFLVTAIASVSVSQSAELPMDAQRTREQIVGKAISYLLTKGRADDGSYNSSAGPAVTALVTTGLLKHGRSAQEPAIAESLQYLEGFVQPDGGVYQPGSTHRNYETSLAVRCFTEANRDGAYDEILKNAEDFLIGLQWDEDEGKQPSDLSYGGAGYGSHTRPDLSNTSYFVDALAARGHDEDSEAMQRALLFISRCQNLETEHNTTKFAPKNPDGGFYYTPAAGGTSQAGETASGGLRSYGSMTYAGLKSMIYAGVGPDDPRVRAAVDWIRQNYGLDSNPGMGGAGLYYYYHTFAKALDAMDMEKFEDAEGNQHDWRVDLIEELASRQQEDGSWINDNERWFEGDPNLVTGYALLALAYCK